MGIFNRLEQPSLRAVTWNDGDDRWYQSMPSSSATFADFPIGPDTALRVSAVFACNSLIAETLASLPCVLYRRLDDGGKERARDHRLYRTLRTQPNRRMTPMDYFGGQQMHLGLRGNALAEIVDDGNTVELLPLHPDYVKVEVLPSGRYRYEIRDPKGGQPRTLLQDRVLHVRDLSMDGIVGQARAQLAREAIAVSAAGEAFVGGFFKNDAMGRLLLTTPTTLTEEKRKELRDNVVANQAGWANRSTVMVVSGGTTATELGKHDDSGFIIDPRRFQVADIARFWRVPLFMIGLEEKSTTWGTGIEQQKQGFVDFTIKSWADRHAQSMSLALLDESEQEEYFIEFLFADLVRGDLMTRMQAYQVGRQIGVWNPDEIRAKENEGPRDDGKGDVYQDTPTGAAPNQPAAQSPTPPADNTPVPQGRAIPAPLMADAVARIANREVSDVGNRLAKAGDPEKWSAWLLKYYTAHQDYVVKVLAPHAEAFGYAEWVPTKAAERVVNTAAWLTAADAPAFLAKRHEAIALLVAETFMVGARVDAVVRTESDTKWHALEVAVQRQGAEHARQMTEILGVLKAVVDQPQPNITVNTAAPAVTVAAAPTPNVEVHAHLPAPAITVEPATVTPPNVEVHNHVAAADPAQITVTAAAPTINVEAAAPVIHVEPAAVSVAPPAVQVFNHIPARETTREVTITSADGHVLRKGTITDKGDA